MYRDFVFPQYANYAIESNSKPAENANQQRVTKICWGREGVNDYS